MGRKEEGLLESKSDNIFWYRGARNGRPSEHNQENMETPENEIVKYIRPFSQTYSTTSKETHNTDHIRQRLDLKIQRR